MTPREVRRHIRDRVASLVPVVDTSTPGGYARGDEVWQEASQLLMPGFEPASWANLRFSVLDTAQRDLRISQSLAGALDTDQPNLGAPVEVRFLYELRPELQADDWDGAGDAGVAVLGALIRDGWPEEADLICTPDVEPLRRDTLQVDSAQWVLVTVRVRAQYPLTLE